LDLQALRVLLDPRVKMDYPAKTANLDLRESPETKDL